MLTLTMLSVAVGACTYLYAKKNNATSGTAAAAGLATGAGTAATLMIAASMWPLFVVLGVPYAAYQLGKSQTDRKSLGSGNGPGLNS